MIARFFAIFIKEKRATALAAIILLQAMCALFFIGDVIVDLTEGDHLDGVHLILEAVAALAMMAGVIYLMRELRDLLSRMAEMDIGIKAARGEMVSLIETFFDQWQLTPSEREIALLILKGIDNNSIGKMRGTAQGTIRAQCTQIYAKAGVDGRTQLLSVFMEELLHAKKE